MSKKQEKKEARFIYKKDLELSKAGFSDFETAKQVEQETKTKYPEPGYRVRLRLRSRTNTWDVVVKVRTEVKEETKPTAKQIQAGRDQDFVAQHALTGA